MFNFFSKSEDKAKNPFLEHTFTNTDVSQLVNTVSLEESITLIKLLPYVPQVRAFLALNNERQDHVFPLLGVHIRNEVIKLFPEERQTDLIKQYEHYNNGAKKFESDPNSSTSFFYWMQAHNAFKHKTQNKLVYILTADKAVQFDLKPYKYQRKLMERHIQCIANGIADSKMMFHPIILAYNDVDKSLTILDGQHRWNALKRVDSSILPEITVQIDVIVFQDNDNDIMQTYKNINTNVPIDQSRMNEEMKYVNLVESIKQAFPKGLRSFSKDLKDPIPQHFIVDSYLKEELQYRQVLDKADTQDVIETLGWVNEHIKRDADLQLSLNLIDGKICKRDNMFLGVSWPLAMDLLEKRLKE